MGQSTWADIQCDSEKECEEVCCEPLQDC